MKTLPAPHWAVIWRGVDIRVFTTGEGSPVSLEDAAGLLNKDEHARAARFHFPVDRERWMRSRALLRLCLAERLNSRPEEVCFNTDHFGKPLVDPFPAEGLHFNLSHSGDFAAVAMAGEPVGVDIERWQEDLSVVELAEFEFQPSEAAFIRRSAEPHRSFYQLWTAKEAVMKCCGAGLLLPPGCVGIGLSGGAPVTAERMEFDLPDFPQAMKHFHLTSHDVRGQWTLTTAIGDHVRNGEH
jgi:4'-phosphopantetheinyl transferase